MRMIKILTITMCLFAASSMQASAESIAFCRVGGCSGQLCESPFDEPMVTTCEWREEYRCYKTARCEWQSNGQCGWTKTEELTQCLAEKREQNNMTDRQ